MHAHTSPGLIYNPFQDWDCFVHEVALALQWSFDFLEIIFESLWSENVFFFNVTWAVLSTMRLLPILSRCVLSASMTSLLPVMYLEITLCFLLSCADISAGFLQAKVFVASSTKLTSPPHPAQLVSGSLTGHQEGHYGLICDWAKAD